jgi:hypothetical protein
MDNTDGSYNCKSCAKTYASYKSLWNHNKKFHTPEPQTPTTAPTKVEIVPTIKPQNMCLYCNKILSRNDARYRHEKTCKTKNNIIKKLEEENKIIKEEIKQLKNKSNNTTNNNTTNNINNGTINNNTFIINKIGEETINKLSYDDIKDIFRQHKNCLYHAISYVNFNKNIPENHNFYNSSLEGKYINVYNNDKNEIEKKNKKDFFDTILLSSISITSLLYERIKRSVSRRKQLKLRKMIDEIKNIAYIGRNKKIYITNFNEISYNNKNIVKNTWNKKLNNLQITDHNSSDDESDNDSDLSNDSFYYVSDSD